MLNSRAKRICIVNMNMFSLFRPDSSAPMGGAELDMYNLSIGLRDYYNVLVITGDWGQNYIENIDGIMIYKSFKLEDGIFNRIWSPFILLNLLFKVNADAYISSGAGPEVGIIALFCKIFNKHYIYRTASEIDCNKQYVRSNIINGLIYKFGFENSDRIITSVKDHKKIISLNHPCVINRIEHINLGLKMNNIVKNRKLNKTNILWVGRCDSNKNPETFLEIAKNNPDNKFMMICPKIKHENKFYLNIINKASKIKNLQFIDYVPFKNIQKYFDRSLVFVNTSNYEGFTYTLIQSGLAKTPVVYLKVNPDSVISKYNIGYFSNGSIELMNDNIRRLLKNNDLWKEKSNEIYKYVCNKHDMNLLSKSWIKLIDSIL